MKKYFIYCYTLMLFAVSQLNAQQWNGNANITDPIYRNGNVGIGITAPLKKLHVNKDIQLGIGGSTWTDPTTSPYIYFKDDNFKIGVNVLSGSSDDIMTFSVYKNSGGFKFTNHFGDNLFCINSFNGNVSIGCTPGVEKLEVNGKIKTTNLGITSLAGTGNRMVIADASGNLLTQSLPANSPWLANGSTIYYNNYVGIGTSTPKQNLDINGRLYIGNGVIQTGGNAITTTSDLGLYSINSGSWMRFVTNNAPIKFFTDGGTNPIGGTEKFTINADGNVGIGISNPDKKLTVNGQIKSASGGFIFPDGSVQTTASSSVIWTPVEEYGAIGDGSTDDRQAIQNAIDAAKNSNQIVMLTPGKTYRITSSIIIGNTLSWEISPSLFIPAGAIILMDGAGPAITFLNNGTISGQGMIKNSSTSWGNSRSGICINGFSNKIDIGTIEGFDYGVKFNGNDGNSVGYNNVQVRYLHDNKYSIFMGISNGGWVNQNYIHFDRIRVEGDAGHPKSDAVGINMYPSSSLPNTNTFSGCIEGVGLGMYLIGRYNRFEGLRLEDCTKKVIVSDSPTETSLDNTFFGDYDVAIFENQTAGNLWEAVSIFGWGNCTYMNNSFTHGTFVYSDVTYKEDIKKIEGALDKVLRLKGASVNA